MQTTTDATIRDIVADNFRTAAIFQRHGLDFCCRGDRRIADACAEKGIDAAAVFSELESVEAVGESAVPNFKSWEPDFLIDYIINNHHRYVRSMLPVLLQHTAKVASVHGERHPEMLEVARHFTGISKELEMHIMKEERILFPYIKSLTMARRAGMAPSAPPFGTVRNPIAMMEEEHRNAGDEMGILRTLTHDYTPPEDACTTFRVMLEELRDFERDLHQHIHLENNILFPKAVMLEGGLA